MDNEAVRRILTSLLSDIASQAKIDSTTGVSNIASIYRPVTDNQFDSLDPQKIEEAIKDINHATATKEGARRLVNALMVVAKTVARIYFPKP